MNGISFDSTLNKVWIMEHNINMFQMHEYMPTTTSINLVTMIFHAIDVLVPNEFPCK